MKYNQTLPQPILARNLTEPPTRSGFYDKKQVNSQVASRSDSDGDRHQRQSQETRDAVKINGPKQKVLSRTDFSQGSKIGDGAYGTVYKVQFHDEAVENKINPRGQGKKTHYGLKEMLITRFISEGRIKEVFIERCILASLDHPSIISFYQSFKNQNKYYLLVEYCPKGSLQDFLKRQTSLDNALVKHMTAELVLALEYLRQMQIVHRDLKPGNIVLDQSYHIKLIDFATCKVFNKDIQARIAAFKSKNDLVKSMGFSDDSELATT